MICAMNEIKTIKFKLIKKYIFIVWGSPHFIPKFFSDLSNWPLITPFPHMNAVIKHRYVFTTFYFCILHFFRSIFSIQQGSCTIFIMIQKLRSQFDTVVKIIQVDSIAITQFFILQMKNNFHLSSNIFRYLSQFLA